MRMRKACISERGAQLSHARVVTVSSLHGNHVELV